MNDVVLVQVANARDDLKKDASSRLRKKRVACLDNVHERPGVAVLKDDAVELLARWRVSSLYWQSGLEGVKELDDPRVVNAHVNVDFLLEALDLGV